MGIMAVTMPTIVRELGASFTQVGIMRGAQALSAGAGSVAGGLATDLIGKRKQLLVLSLLWPTVFVFLGGFSPSFLYFALFMVVRELLGGFLWHPPAMATIAEMFPGRKAFGFSLHEAGANIGSSVGPLVTGFLLTYISWRMIYHGYLIPGLATGMMIWPG
jgi:MFS family permease